MTPGEITQQAVEKWIENGRDMRLASPVLEAIEPYVLSVCRKFIYALRRRGVPAEDLLQSARIGVMQALEKYDESVGMFSTYASFWIHKEVYCFMRDFGHQVRIPNNKPFVELLSHYSDLKEAIRESNPKITMSEVHDLIADRLRIPRFYVDLFCETKQYSKSMDAVNSFGETYGSTMTDGRDFEREYIDTMYLTNVRDKASSLYTDASPCERDIVVRRFLADEPVTLREIGEDYGRTRERIRQIEVEVLRRLKSVLSKNFPEGATL